MNVVSLQKIKRFTLSPPTLACLAVLIIFVMVFGHHGKTDIQPYWDEPYHVTDDLAQGNFRGINPLDPKYDFMGHPPGYPVTVFAWFRVFPKTFQSARYHALTFSFLALLTFFWFCWINTNWVLAMAATYAVAGSPHFVYNIHRTIADIPSLTFLFLTLISLQRRSFIWAGSFCFAYCMVRESGLALVAGIILSYFILCTFKEKVISLKSLTIVIAPPIVGLSIFYSICRYTRGETLLHPNAANSPSFYKSLVTWTTAKEESFQKLLGVLQDNSPVPLLLVIFFFVFALFHRKKIRLSTLDTFSHLSFLFAAFGFLVFFTLYEDIAGRDIFPTILACIYFPILITSHLGHRYSLLIVGLILTFTPFRGIYHSERPDTKLIGEVARLVEAEYLGRRICMIAPFRQVKIDRIHGYFKTANPYIYDCKNPEFIILEERSRASLEKNVLEMIENKEFSLKTTLKSLTIDSQYKIYTRTKRELNTNRTR